MSKSDRSIKQNHLQTVLSLKLSKDMFGLFKKESEIEKLSKKYARLMKEAHQLWQTNRAAGDQKVAEAEEIAKQIEEIKKNQQ